MAIFSCFNKSKRRSASVNPKMKPTVAQLKCDKCSKEFPSEHTLNIHKSYDCEADPVVRNKGEPPKQPESRLTTPSGPSDNKTPDLRQSSVKIAVNSKIVDLCRSETTSVTDDKSSTKQLDELEKFVQTLKNKPLSERRNLEFQFINKNIEKKTSNRYTVDEGWIDQYTNFLNNNTDQIPSAIDNSKIQQQVQKRGFRENIYQVNERIWRFMMKMYGGGPEIKQSSKNSSISQIDSDKYSDLKTADTMVTRSEAADSLFDASIHRPSNVSISDSKPCGMTNPKFFCYMNASIQVLLSIKRFADFACKEKQYASLNTKAPKFWKAFAEVIYHNSKGSLRFTPRLLRKLSQDFFDPNYQHDAHEFMVYLLSGMQEEMTVSAPKKEIEFSNANAAWDYYQKYNNSIIDQLFAGQLVSKVECKSCGYESATYDPFLDLSLPIISGKTKSLEDCMAAFLKDEEIRNSYTCEKCKSNDRAVKKLSINRFPQLLLINLKRFQTLPIKKKIKDFVEFPIEKMKMKKSNGSQESIVYDLIGVVMHFGSVESGHYVSFTKRSGQWYLCDDEDIKLTSAKELLNKEAYVLLYEATSY